MRDDITYKDIFSAAGEMLDLAAVGDRVGVLNAHDRSRLFCTLMPNIDCAIPQMCDSIFDRAHNRMVMDGVVW